MYVSKGTMILASIIIAAAFILFFAALLGWLGPTAG